MIAKILARINKGACTQDILAEEFGLRKNTVAALLEFMVHEGYLEEIVCETECRACPLKCDVPMPTKMHTVTLKGRRYIKNKKSKVH
jgi:hypothetical protein